MHPRKVRGGVRLENRDGAQLAWAGQRWMRLIEDHAPNAALTEGLAYAKMGQTRALSINPGHISARVQGRMPSAYAVDIRMPVFTHEQWEAATTAMLEEARHLAGLLSGDVPPGIEDLFAPLHLRLFPQDNSDLALSCSCARNPARILTAPLVMTQDRSATPPPTPPAPTPPGVSPLADPAEASADAPFANAPDAAGPAASPTLPGPTTPAAPADGDPFVHPAGPAGPAPAQAQSPVQGPWCKHVCCVMALLAERVSRDPFMVFALRGMSKEDLLERLRQKRALLSSARQKPGAPSVPGGSPGLVPGGERPVPAYSPRIPGVGEEPAPALELCLAEFWHLGPQLEELDLPLVRPEASHVLLRRLGPTPFADGKFPLLGLLQTCYDVICEHALREDQGESAAPPEIDPETDPDGNPD